MHSVQEFVEFAFAEAELLWKDHVEIDPRYMRPTEVDALQGDATTARKKLGWKPRSGFAALVKIMVEHDLELARRERTLRDAGYSDPVRGAAARFG
jgi:GDPmannose 4,6-dehydratase